MPCRDPGYEENDRRIEVQKLHYVTRAACDMRTILRRHKLEDELCEETKEWIAEHDKWDEERTQQEEEKMLKEETKRRALAKLNVDERRILGL